MNDIPFLTESNFYEVCERINYSDKEPLLRTLRDMIDYAPFMSRIISRFMLVCIKNNPECESEIRERIGAPSENPEINLSRCIYGALMGAKTNLSRIQQVSQIFSDMIMECREMEKYQDKVENFFCVSVLKRLSFNKKECALRLSMLPPGCVVSTILRDQSLSNISLMVQACKYHELLPELEKQINGFERKNDIIAMVFINFFSSRSVYSDRHRNDKIEKEKQILSRLIVGDTFKHCLKVGNREFLGMLLKKEFRDSETKKITYNEFRGMHFNTKRDFFCSFLALTSPSVSHFLSYLEIYKDRFVLSHEEQAMLVDMIREMHANNLGYADIVISKLLKFRIISSKTL